MADDFNLDAAEEATMSRLGGQSEGQETETHEEQSHEWPGETETEAGYDEPTSDQEQSGAEEEGDDQYITWDPEAETAAKTLFKIKYRDKEIDVPYEDLKNYAEQGVDYTQKRQRDAEVLEWAEKNREPYERLGEALRQDTELASVIAAMDNPQFREMMRTSGFFGNMSQSGNQLAQMNNPQVQALQNELNQLKAQQQQQTQAQQTEQQVNQLRQQYNEIKTEYPSLFKGPMAARNEMAWRQEAEKLEQQGIHDLEYAFNRAFKSQLGQISQSQTINQYVQSKTRGQGPPVQGRGGRAPSGKPKPKTAEDAFDMAESSAFERFQAAESM